MELPSDNLIAEVDVAGRFDHLLRPLSFAGMASPSYTRRDVADTELTRNFELEISPAGIPVANHFKLGASSDFDLGGFVASEIIRNLKLCITEKAAKIAPYIDRYREWWPVLPDCIGPDLNADEQSTIGEHVNTLKFSRVVLIHPRDPTRALIMTQPRAKFNPSD